MSKENNIIEIQRCCQRGGRMLSIIDLVRKETFTLREAAYLASRIRKGASFIIGAVPGGAGKTTVMGALLNLLPDRMDIIPCENSSVIRSLKDAEPVCALAHEISHGSYYCYIWGQTLRDFFSLSEKGHTIATNLHADTLDQAKEQICADNNADPTHFSAIDFYIFLRLSGGFMSKTVTAHVIHEADGKGGYRKADPDFPIQSDPENIHQWEQLIEEMDRKDIYTIEQVREYISD